MKKISKIIAFLMMVCLLSGLLAGCGSDTAAPASSSSASSGGGDADGDDSGDNGSSGEADTGLDLSEEVEIILYLVSDRPAKQDEIDANFNALIKEKLNCTLKTNWIGWAEYANKYPLLFSSGEKFDMAETGTWLNFSSLAQKGAFMALDELWPTYAPINFSKQSEVAKQQATVDGHYYTVPTLLSTYNARGILYRTDILEGTDWDGKLETMSDYEVYLSYVKEYAPEYESTDIYQSGSMLDDLFMYERKMHPIKGSTNDFLWIDPFEESPQLFTYYEYEHTPEFLEMMTRWNENGYFTKSALSDTDSQKFQNGKAASLAQNIDAYENQYILNPDRGIGFANMVTDISKKAFTQDAMVVSNTSQNPERALALYDLLTSDEETFRTYYYGIEGTSYEVIDNQVKVLDTDNYALSSFWAIRTDDLYLSAYGSPADLIGIKEGFNQYIAEVNGEGSQKYRGFVFSTESIETEYAACQNVHQQYWWPLELGYTDAVSGLAEYQSKMDAAGVEKVRAEIQRQLDEYIASLG